MDPAERRARTTTVDDDGDLDYFVPHGFLACALPLIGPGHCGGLRWYETTGQGQYVPHVIVPKGSKLFYHVAEFVDFDGDGIEDLVTTGEEKGFLLKKDRAVVQWFKGTNGPDRFETTPRAIGPGLGSLPSVRDLDGDGDLDIASAEYFANLKTSFAWYERAADPSLEKPAGEFVRHVIDDSSGPSIQLSFVEDLFGDGVLRAVGANHTNTAKSPPDPWESVGVRGPCLRDSGGSTPALAQDAALHGHPLASRHAYLSPGGTWDLRHRRRRRRR